MKTSENIGISKKEKKEFRKNVTTWISICYKLWKKKEEDEIEDGIEDEEMTLEEDIE